jgi:glycosyltransferase involved in cell wall biosynthesis
MNQKECLSVVMPVFNERETVLDIVDQVLKLDIVKELVIVDDGSTDGTKEVLQSRQFGPKVRTIFHEKNLGKGAALCTGYREVSGEIVVPQDADLEYDPSELVPLTEPIRKGMADVVYGSRLWGGRPQRAYFYWHKVGNRFLTFMVDILYNTTLTDIETCYKAFRRDILDSVTLKSKGFSIEPEFTAKVLKKRLRVYEMPISYYGRTYNEGKKITWKQGISALITILWYRFFD